MTKVDVPEEEKTESVGQLLIVTHEYWFGSRPRDLHDRVHLYKRVLCVLGSAPRFDFLLNIVVVIDIESGEILLVDASRVDGTIQSFSSESWALEL